MRTSILICATCLLVTGCSAQFRLPSLSSALSSLTGFGGSSSSSNGAQSGQSSPSSPYSGLVRDYGRNLMMAMSSIYPTLFKPPQSQQQAQQQQAQQQAPQSPFDAFGAASQQQSIFPSQSSGPSFTLGGSTFSISPSFPFGSLSGASQPQASQGAGPQPGAGSHSPFSASFGSSINSPPSFGPLSSSPFLSQSMPSFAPASSYNAAFEAANGGAGAGPQSLGSSMFAGLGQGPAGLQAGAGAMAAGGQLQSQGGQLGSFSSVPGAFGAQHDSSAQILSQPSHHQPQSAAPLSQAPGLGSHHSASPFGASPPQGQQAAMGQQFAGSQQFRPDMMSIAASAPVPSSNSYSNYGSVPAQQGPAPSASSASSSYQQPSYR